MGPSPGFRTRTGDVAVTLPVGAGPGTVAPDRAASLPAVSDDCLTYTFRLRPGIRWSDGGPVTGADVKRGLERTVAAKIWPLYSGIRGAHGCTKTTCDLSRGISADKTS